MSGGDRGVRARTERAEVPTVFLELVAAIGMEDLAHADGLIAMGLEVLWEGDGVPGGFAFPDLWAEVIDACGGGVGPGEEADSGGIADRCLAVSVGEGDAPLSEPIEVGRYALGVSAERADPVVEVVDGDEEHIGVVGWLSV